MPTRTYIKETCALCGGRLLPGKSGICTHCFHEFGIVTPTGTYRPKWIDDFIPTHRSFERQMASTEVPLSTLPPDFMNQFSYTEVRYEIIEEKHRKIERRGRPRRLINSHKNIS